MRYGPAACSQSHELPQFCSVHACLSTWHSLAAFLCYQSAADITEPFHLCDQVQNCSIFFPSSSKTKRKSVEKDFLDYCFLLADKIRKKDLWKSYKITVSARVPLCSPYTSFFIFLPHLSLFSDLSVKKVGVDFSWHEFKLPCFS